MVLYIHRRFARLCHLISDIALQKFEWRASLLRISYMRDSLELLVIKETYARFSLTSENLVLAKEFK